MKENKEYPGHSSKGTWEVNIHNGQKNSNQWKMESILNIFEIFSTQLEREKSQISMPHQY